MKMECLDCSKAKHFFQISGSLKLCTFCADVNCNTNSKIFLIYLCVYTRVYRDLSLYTYRDRQTYIYKHKQRWRSKYAHICMHMCEHTNVCIFVNTHLCTQQSLKSNGLLDWQSNIISKAYMLPALITSGATIIN